jgi:DHA3 family macrolide efflux protein-like MFS transporter
MKPVWQILLLMFIRSIAGGFHYPAMAASTSLMVPKVHLARIQGLNSMVGGGMNILAAPLGAMLIELLPMQGVLAIDVITALIAISPLFFLSVPQPVRSNQPADAGQQQAADKKPSAGFQAGLRYIVA